jgi:hypothetical protein
MIFSVARLYTTSNIKHRRVMHVMHAMRTMRAQQLPYSSKSAGRLLRSMPLVALALAVMCAVTGTIAYTVFNSADRKETFLHENGQIGKEDGKECKGAAISALVTLVGADELANQPGLEAYFRRFNVGDMTARRCASSQACKRDYLAAVISPDDVSPVFQRALNQVADHAYRACSRNAPRFLRLFPLRIAVMGSNVEGGWPHTHGDVICLPDTFDSFGKAGPGNTGDPAARARTLVHEMVHVAQRQSPDWVRDTVQATWGYAPLGRTHDLLPPSDIMRLRSNPDLDGVLYSAPDGSVAAQQFPKRRAPRGLSDSRIETILPPSILEQSHLSVQRNSTCDTGTTGRADPIRTTTDLRRHQYWKYEHPWERMAYEIAERVVPSV